MTLDGKLEIAPGNPDAMPPGTEEAPALICESNDETTPDGNAVTGKLTPDGGIKPDDRIMLGAEVAPALI
jgi:hypothetical protein